MNDIYMASAWPNLPNSECHQATYRSKAAHPGRKTIYPPSQKKERMLPTALVGWLLMKQPL